MDKLKFLQTIIEITKECDTKKITITQASGTIMHEGLQAGLYNNSDTLIESILDIAGELEISDVEPTTELQKIADWQLLKSGVELLRRYLGQ